MNAPFYHHHPQVDRSTSGTTDPQPQTDVGQAEKERQAAGSAVPHTGNGIQILCGDLCLQLTTASREDHEEWSQALAMAVANQNGLRRSPGGNVLVRRTSVPLFGPEHERYDGFNAYISLELTTRCSSATGTTMPHSCCTMARKTLTTGAA